MPPPSLDVTKNEKLGVRGKLLILVSLGIFSVAVLVSLLFVWVSLKEHEKSIKTQGSKLSSELVDKIILPMLYGDRDHVKEIVDEFYKLNNIAQVTVYLKNLEVCTKNGKSNYENWTFDPEVMSSSSLSFKRKAEYWHFIRPVMFGKNIGEENVEDLFSPAMTEGNELFGYVHIAINITSIYQLLWKTFLTTSFLASGITVALLFLVNLGINRLIKPLCILAGAMKNTLPVSQFNGPKELMDIASTYNEMIQTLAERDQMLSNYNRKLEAEVKIRTKELVEARDLALASSKAKSQFMANTSHELRTPLQSVLGYTELVKEAALYSGRVEMLENLDVIETDAKKLLGLINTILDLAKIESGNMELKLQETNLKEVIREAVNTVRPMLDYNRNLFILVNRIDDNRKAKVDRTKAIQILTNILSNAAKYTTNGTVTLTAYIRDHFLVVSTSDTGIGISEEQLGLIFEPFKQVDNSLTRVFGGTGLGLAITKQFCTLMGGNISVESQVGKGTTFTVEIPLSRH